MGNALERAVLYRFDVKYNQYDVCIEHLICGLIWKESNQGKGEGGGKALMGAVQVEFNVPNGSIYRSVLFRVQNIRVQKLAYPCVLI